RGGRGAGPGGAVWRGARGGGEGGSCTPSGALAIAKREGCSIARRRGQDDEARLGVVRARVVVRETAASRAASRRARRPTPAARRALTETPGFPTECARGSPTREDRSLRTSSACRSRRSRDRR